MLDCVRDLYSIFPNIARTLISDQYPLSCKGVRQQVVGQTTLSRNQRAAWVERFLQLVSRRGLWLLEDENRARIALFGSSAAPNIASIRAYLSCIARRAGIKFFTYEVTSLGCSRTENVKGSDQKHPRVE